MSIYFPAEAGTHFTKPRRIEGLVVLVASCLVTYPDGLPARRQVTHLSK